jgi:hypothetical protein
MSNVRHQVLRPMGLALFVAVLLYAAVAFAVLGISVLSAVRCRKIPPFWLVALACAALGPFVLNAPVPVNRGGADGWVGYLLEAAFTKFNLIYFWCGLVCACRRHATPRHSCSLSRKLGSGRVLRGADFSSSWLLGHPGLHECRADA